MSLWDRLFCQKSSCQLLILMDSGEDTSEEAEKIWYDCIMSYWKRNTHTHKHTPLVLYFICMNMNCVGVFVCVWRGGSTYKSPKYISYKQPVTQCVPRVYTVSNSLRFVTEACSSLGCSNQMFCVTHLVLAHKMLLPYPWVANVTVMWHSMWNKCGRQYTDCVLFDCSRKDTCLDTDFIKTSYKRKRDTKVM